MNTIIESLLLALGWVIFAGWLYHAIRIVVFVRSQPPLDAVADLNPPGDAPRVCAIVPACDEEASVEACLRSLVAQDYPDLHVIAVDDRSSDGTGAIMDRVASETDRLTVLHVEALPEGWLGKNHANWRGVTHEAAADADYIVFTDGDVLFEPDCVRRAMAYVRRERVDLLSLFPDLIPGGFLENAMCHFFGLCYLLKTKAWNVANPDRLNAFAGIGAFNLVERKVYEYAGGHERLRMEVADDYKLGKIVKQAGGWCALLGSEGRIRVRWQIGLGGVVRGLEKNAFAGCDYSIPFMLFAVFALLAMFVLPWVMLLIASGWSWWGWLGAASGPVVLLGWLARRSGRSVVHGLLSPVCALAMTWACIRATCLALGRGGIVWRGTFYGLDALKRGLV